MTTTGEVGLDSRMMRSSTRLTLLLLPLIVLQLLKLFAKYYMNSAV
jgi:hypothetical protein